MKKKTGTPERKVSEMIGRTAPGTNIINLYPARPSVDRTKVDYKYYGQLRRGKARGYELGGSFAMPIARIMASWALGRGVTVTDTGGTSSSGNQATQDALKNFIDSNLKILLETIRDSYTLGDGYLAVNPDGTLTRLSPDQVEIETDPDDYRRVTAYTIITALDEPLVFTPDLVSVRVQNPTSDSYMNVLVNQTPATETVIRDQWRRDKRIVSIQRGGNTPTVTEFPNLIGDLPIIHFAYGQEANEITGHPVFEQLLYLFKRYDNVINKALDGVEMMGNPFLSIEGLENPEQAREENATSFITETVDDGEGGTDTFQRPMLDLSAPGFALWLGTNATARYVTPGAFTQEAGRVLELLFLLMLQNTGVIEGVWGGAMNSSRASLDAQMPAFARTVAGWQMDLTPGILQLCTVFLAYRSLVEPGVRLRGDLKAVYPELLPKDEKLMLEKVKFAREDNAIPKVEGLELLELSEDPKASKEAAQKEALESQQQFEDQMQRNIDDLANRGDEDTSDPAAEDTGDQETERDGAA